MRFAAEVDHALHLALPTEADDESTFALVEQHRDYLRRWLPWVDQTHAVEAVARHRARSLEWFARGEAVVCNIFHRDRLVGRIGLERIRQEPMTEWGVTYSDAEIGYWLAEDAQGHGVMSRCVQAMLRHGFEDRRLSRIVIKSEPDNHRSCRVAERVGMKHEGTLRCVARFQGRRVDHNLYAMIADDWTASV